MWRLALQVQVHTFSGSWVPQEIAQRPRLVGRLLSPGASFSDGGARLAVAFLSVSGATATVAVCR